MPDIIQLDNGTYVIRNETDGIADLIVGGPATPTVAQPRFRNIRVMHIPLTASDATNGGIFAWQNSNAPGVIASPIMVTKVELNITTAATSTCAASIGQSATQIISSNLLDTVVVSTAGVVDNFTDKGAAGKTRQKVAVGEYITGCKTSGSSGGLAGSAYIHFFPLS